MRKKTILTILILLGAFLLRVYKLTQVPVSLYWEEVALAYDAWSLATTGKDLHGQAWPIVALTSFGDYKPSGYFYVLALMIKIFGPHDWVIKLPSLIAGLVIVYASGRLLAQLLRYEKESLQNVMSLVTMFLASINPVLIHLSRVGFETNLALAFSLVGLLFLTHPQAFARRKGLNFYFLGGLIFFILSFYTYHAMRIIAPLLGLLVLNLHFWPFDKKHLRFWFLNLSLLLIISLLALAPFLGQLSDRVVSQRWQETSIFADLSLIEASNQCRLWGGDNCWSRLACHRYWFYGRLMGQQALKHFNLAYLFLTGETNLRHNSGFFGLFYFFDFLPLSLGFYWLARRSRRDCKLVFFFFAMMIIALIPVSLTETAPHLLRSLPLVICLLWLIALGWWQLRQFLAQYKFSFLFAILAFGLYLSQLGFYQWHYYHYYAPTSGVWWQEGYRQAMAILSQWQAEKPDLPVYITHVLGRPSIYYFWYDKIPPAQVQARHGLEKMDQGEFLSYKSVSFIGWQKEQNQLAILAPEEFSLLDETSLIRSQAIKNYQGETILLVGEIDNEKLAE